MKKIILLFLLSIALLTPSCKNDSSDKGKPSILVIYSYMAIENSICLALDELNYTYTIADTATVDWTTVDFSPYDIVILGLDGVLDSDGNGNGIISTESVANLRTSIIDKGKRLILLGGCVSSPYITGIYNNLFKVSTTSYSWALCASNDLLLLNPDHPLGDGLPDTWNFFDANTATYMYRVTDTAITTIAGNGDGLPVYFHKSYDTGGDLICFIYTPAEMYWYNLLDYAILKTVIKNSINY